jgi:amino acid transporter
LNIISVKKTSLFQNILVIFLFLILLLYSLRGIVEVNTDYYTPFFKTGFSGFLGTVGMLFVSFGGFDSAIEVSGEVKNPKVNLPVGLFLAFFLTTFLYVLSITVTVGTLSPDALSSSLTPIADGAMTFSGLIGVVCITVASFLAFATTANGGILSASRSPHAMSIDGMYPSFLSQKIKSFKTPVYSILLTSLIIMAIVIFLDVEQVAKTTSAMFLFQFILTNAALIIMRRANLEGYRPSVKVPLFPWIPLFGIVVYIFILIDLGKIPLFTLLFFLVACSVWYFVSIRHKILRESAFVYIVKRAISTKMERFHLEDELLAIALEREGIVPDRFDEVITRSITLDYDKKINAKDLFEKVSHSLAERTGISSETVLRL